MVGTAEATGSTCALLAPALKARLREMGPGQVLLARVDDPAACLGVQARCTLTSNRANGGQIWACGTCAKPRGITEDDLIEGARIVTASYVVQYLASGAASISF
jgi:hypothetical protein